VNLQIAVVLDVQLIVKAVVKVVVVLYADSIVAQAVVLDQFTTK